MDPIFSKLSIMTSFIFRPPPIKNFFVKTSCDNIILIQAFDLRYQSQGIWTQKISNRLMSWPIEWRRSLRTSQVTILSSDGRNMLFLRSRWGSRPYVACAYSWTWNSISVLRNLLSRMLIVIGTLKKTVKNMSFQN